MSDDPGTVQEAPPPPAKEDPETLALRAQPPRAIRFRRSVIIGLAGLGLMHLAIPALPFAPRMDYLLTAEALALLIGLIAGVWPAMNAARLDPIEALRLRATRLGVWRRGKRIASTPAPMASLNLPGRPAQTTLLS